ncbi:MAG: haloacid dehalogenase-like hydrolase [Desulfovibrio sp.]|jgi:phosphoglycolate phosphatase-like HAD superfamily hydrolase|nr:haloacid dehalogenase-like hydrolase [Desulfovibrio sp.]
MTQAKRLISALVFDCDGVILESADIKSRAFFALAEPFGLDAQRRFLRYHERHVGVSRFAKFSWLYATIEGRAISPEESEELGRRFAGLCKEAVLAAPFVSGFQDLLEEWHGRAPLFVASGTPRRELAEILEARGIAGKFAGVYGTPPDKAALLRRLIADHALDPAATVMFGDGETDYEAARQAGTLFFGRGKRFAGRGCLWAEDLLPAKDMLENSLV